MPRTSHQALFSLCATSLIAMSGICQAQEAASTPSVANGSGPVTSAHSEGSRWNETFLSARYGQDYHFPGKADKVAQKIGGITTTGGFKYGNYIFNAEYLESDEHNPVAYGHTGAQEVYSVGRVELSTSKLLGQPVGNSLVRDYSLTVGYDVSAKNDIFGSRARMLVVGPTVDFAVPRGRWNLTAGLRTESNHNGISRTDVSYDTAWHVESSWLFPVHLGAVPTVFKGFASVTGPKGQDGFHHETETEVLTRMSWLFDVGALAGSPRTVLVGPGYEYWHNMFGTPASESPGTRRSAAALVAEFHF
jgi:hypothetical protein